MWPHQDELWNRKGSRIRSEESALNRGELMSELSRWKEYRIRQAIYLEGLKHSRTPSIQAGPNGSNAEMGRASLQGLLQDTPVVRAGRSLDRTKTDRLSGTVLRFGLLAGSVVIWLLLWWVEFGIRR
jgi:hypothetical protein